MSKSVIYGISDTGIVKENVCYSTIFNLSCLTFNVSNISCLSLSCINISCTHLYNNNNSSLTSLSYGAVSTSLVAFINSSVKSLFNGAVSTCLVTYI